MYFIAIFLALPVALLAACDVLVLTSEDGDDPIIGWWAILGIFLLVWAGIAYWSSRVQPRKKAIARVCLALAIVGFLTPLSGLYQWLTAGVVQNPIYPTWFTVFIGLVVGTPAVWIGLVGYRVLRGPSDEDGLREVVIMGFAWALAIAMLIITAYFLMNVLFTSF